MNPSLRDELQQYEKNLKNQFQNLNLNENAPNKYYENNQSQAKKNINDKKKKKNFIDSNDLIKELEKLNLPKENTIIKPKNGITDVLNRKKYQNKKSFSPILQERVKSKFSSYNNLVQPMNKNKKVQINIFDPISIGIENLKYKITHKKSDSKSFFTNANSKDEDYFFNLYKDYSNQNQSLKILNKKVYKISQFENEKKNNFVSFSKKNIL